MSTETRVKRQENYIQNKINKDLLNELFLKLDSFDNKDWVDIDIDN